MVRALMIGDNNVDIYEHQNMVYPGGSCLNAAAYASRLGHRAAFISPVGNDALGELQLGSLNRLGVDTSMAHIVNEQTAWCRIRQENGERIFGEHDISARERHPLTKVDVRKGHSGAFDLLYTCTDGFFEEGAFEAFAEGETSTVCDFTAKWSEDILAQKCRYITYAFISCEGKGETEAVHALKLCVDAGASMAVATMGLAGSIAYDGRRFHRQKAYTVQALDTLGAGDSFITCFICSFIDGKRQLDASLKALGWNSDNPNYRDCLDKLVEASLAAAALFAAQTCTVMGAFGYGIPFEPFMISRSGTAGNRRGR